jgi:hypothetical protein
MVFVLNDLLTLFWRSEVGDPKTLRFERNFKETNFRPKNTPDCMRVFGPPLFDRDLEIF